MRDGLSGLLRSPSELITLAVAGVIVAGTVVTASDGDAVSTAIEEQRTGHHHQQQQRDDGRDGYVSGRSSARATPAPTPELTPSQGLLGPLVVDDGHGNPVHAVQPELTPWLEHTPSGTTSTSPSATATPGTPTTRPTPSGTTGPGTSTGTPPTTPAPDPETTVPADPAHPPVTSTPPPTTTPTPTPSDPPGQPDGLGEQPPSHSPSLPVVTIPTVRSTDEPGTDAPDD